ncbi:MAG: flagellar hook capping protein [Proteobacteria bacterium]|nr:flagellar hook capping protein [Pseudomonadota bacterium]MBU6425439.1 flagellar hook capping protein [Rhodospirillales bacterium]
MTSLATNGVNSANAASVAASTTASNSSSGSASSLTQSDFLQLLTAQLKYQSPSSPADPTQMAQEFAAISTVQGINQLNTQLSAISASNGASQIAQASSLVGRQVAVSGSNIIADSSSKADGAFSLPSATASTNVTILNPNGSVATTLDLGALPAGPQSFSWSGGTAGTTYSYDISATDASGNSVSPTPYTVYNVQGVNLSGSSPTLNVAGSATPLPVSSVQTVLGASS